MVSEKLMELRISNPLILEILPNFLFRLTLQEPFIQSQSYLPFH